MRRSVLTYAFVCASMRGMPATPNKWRNFGRNETPPSHPLPFEVLRELKSDQLFTILPGDRASNCVWTCIDSLFFCINTKTNYVRKLIYSFDMYDLESYLWQQNHWDLAEVGQDTRDSLYALQRYCEGSIPCEVYKVFELGQLKLPEWGAAVSGFRGMVNKTFRSAFPEGQILNTPDAKEQLLDALNDIKS